MYIHTYTGDNEDDEDDDKDLDVSNLNISKFDDASLDIISLDDDFNSGKEVDICVVIRIYIYM
jgi:hypothetical protein